jgi:hypothetical protein
VAGRRLVWDFALDIPIFHSATTKFAKLAANFNSMKMVGNNKGRGA